MDSTEQTLVEALVAGLVGGDLVEYERYGDLDFSMRRGASYVRQLALALAERDTVDEALHLWLPSVRYQSVWRYLYEWLSWQPATADLQHQDAAVATLRHQLATADLDTARAAFSDFGRAMRRFPCPKEKQEEVERGFNEAVALVGQRWEQLEAYRRKLEALLARRELPALRDTLQHAQMLSNWEVLRQLMQRKGATFVMPHPPNDPPGAPLFARRVMEVLDAANQVPRAAALHSAAHEFEKYPRLLAKLAVPTAESPLEAIDLWFAKLLREEKIRYSTLARIYVAFDAFRRFASTIEPSELRRLIGYLGNSAIFFAFQYAFERDQADQFRRSLGEHLDLRDEEGTLRRLVEALTTLYQQNGWTSAEASLRHLAGPNSQSLLDSLRETAASLVSKDTRADAAAVGERARMLLEQTLRLAIYRPATLRAAKVAAVEEPVAA